MNLKEALVSRERKRKPTEFGSHDPVDRLAKIANRAYELYEQRGRQDGQALDDWLQAEREIRGR